MPILIVKTAKITQKYSETTPKIPSKTTINNKHGLALAQ